MLDRCTVPSATHYDRYGGRGITVHPSLKTIEGFLAEIGPRPSRHHSIERIDNDGNYEPGNIRWATAKEQNRNQSSNQLLTFANRTQCKAAWAEEYGIKYTTFDERLRRGWSVERALTQPLRYISRRSSQQ